VTSASSPSPDAAAAEKDRGEGGSSSFVLFVFFVFVSDTDSDSQRQRGTFDEDSPSLGVVVVVAASMNPAAEAAAAAAAIRRRIPPSSEANNDDDDDDDDEDERERALADNTEEMIRFSSHLIQSYLEDQRASEPLLPPGDGDDERERERDSGGREEAARQSSSADDDAAGRRREGCPCRTVSGLDAMLGVSLFMYGLTLPLVALIRGTFYHHNTAVPLAATAASIVFGSVLARSAAKGRWTAPATAAAFEVAVAILSGLKWDVLAKYLVEHREAMLLSAAFVERSRDDARFKAWAVAILSLLAAAEVCRALAMARESRTAAMQPQRTLSSPEGGSYQRLGDEEEAGGNDNDDDNDGWAVDNARRWERWRDESDPGLRDRNGNLDPDALRRYGRGRSGGTRREDDEEQGRSSLEEPLIGRGARRQMQREESFEVRHGLSRRRRRREEGEEGESNGGGGGSGLLSSLKFWGRGASGARESADVASVGEESSAGFAPVEEEVPEPGGVSGP